MEYYNSTDIDSIKCVYLWENITMTDSLSPFCFDTKSSMVTSVTLLTQNQTDFKFTNHVSESESMNQVWVIFAGFLVFCM